MDKMKAVYFQRIRDHERREVILGAHIRELEAALESIWNDPTTSPSALRAKAYAAWSPAQLCQHVWVDSPDVSDIHCVKCSAPQRGNAE